MSLINVEYGNREQLSKSTIETVCRFPYWWTLYRHIVRKMANLYSQLSPEQKRVSNSIRQMEPYHLANLARLSKDIPN